MKINKSFCNAQTFVQLRNHKMLFVHFFPPRPASSITSNVYSDITLVLCVLQRKEECADVTYSQCARAKLSYHTLFTAAITHSQMLEVEQAVEQHYKLCRTKLGITN